MSTKDAVVAEHGTEDIKLRSYIIGFVSSIVLTLISYLLVVNQSLSRFKLISIIIGLALVQFTIQLIYFLHLGAERKPRWKFVVFSFMVSVVLILVIGSIWIMDNLNYHMLTGHELEQHLHTEEGL
jgi:cytochrome o ubiquinol oxidase operon protein cyoD